MGNSYTMTKQEMVEAIKNRVAEGVVSAFRAYMDGNVSCNHFEKWYAISGAVGIKSPQNALLNRLMNYWAEELSEKWLEAHPDVDDVLLLVDDTDTNCIIKSWLVSR